LVWIVWPKFVKKEKRKKKKKDVEIDWFVSGYPASVLGHYTKAV
jgi:hypothetical protein